MEGAFSESGPYHIQEYTTPPTLAVNPYTWNNVTNNLFIESPAGVGFSYCEDPAGCSHTDTSTAEDNLQALISFFAAYPEYSKAKFWISGESYAGIYVPMLAYNVVKYNAGKPAQPINLQGTMVGNGCIGYDAGHCGNDPLNDYHDIQEWRGHALVSETLYDAILGNCTWGNENNVCQALLNEAASNLGNLDVYYLYNTCPNPASARRSLRAPLGKKSLLRRAMDFAEEKAKAEGLALDPNCFGTGPTLEKWFNQDSTKAAFHVAPAIDWALCSNNASFNYNPDMPDERKTIYPGLVAAGLKVLVYNGEADLCVPYTDNEWWTRSMGYKVADAWQPWTVPGEEGAYVGGYIIHYAVPNGANFSFATIRGAGHMVPETRPEAAFHMMRRWTTGTL